MLHLGKLFREVLHHLLVHRVAVRFVLKDDEGESDCFAFCRFCHIQETHRFWTNAALRAEVITDALKVLERPKALPNPRTFSRHRFICGVFLFWDREDVTFDVFWHRRSALSCG